MYLFFIGVFLVFTCINGYIFLHTLRALPASKTLRILFSAVYFVFYSSFILAMLGRNVLPLAVQKPLYFIGTTWLGVMFYFTIYLALTDILYIICRLFRISLLRNRKIFCQIRIVCGYLIVVCLLIYGYHQYTHPQIVEKEISIHKTAGDYKELKVVGVSDLHLGVNADKKRLAKQVDLIFAQHPDLILIAGDMIDNNLLPLEEEKMWEEVNRLQAPLGIYFCLGNHEYLSGIEVSMNFLEKTKMQLLIDDMIEVNDGFTIIGRDDKQGSPARKSLKELVEKADTSKPLFLIDHEPYHLEEAENNGIDLQFSGHTHNGQLWPVNLFVSRIYEVGYGYKQKGNTHYYVSSGLGLWGPECRIGTQSELVVFNIRFK